MTRIAVLVGSLRAESTNRKIAEQLRDNAPDGVEVDIVDHLAAVPFYNEDIDGDDAPDAAVSLRERVDAADRLLLVTPEYNATMPAALNNAIDWLSRPYGAGALAGKPVGVIGITPTQYGGKWAHEDARRSARIAGATVVEDIDLSQSSIGVDVFTDADVQQKLRTAIEQLVAFEATAAA